MSDNWFLRFFEKNGLIKILAAFIIMIVSVLFLRSYPHSNFFAVTAYIGLGYLVTSFLLFLGAGIINSIKDGIKKRKAKK